MPLWQVQTDPDRRRAGTPIRKAQPAMTYANLLCPRCDRPYFSPDPIRDMGEDCPDCQTAGDQAAIDWTNAQHADGPELAAWIQEKLKDSPEGRGNDSLSRSIRKWAAGGRAEFHSVDRWLTRAGLHPSEAPEHVWR